MGWKGELLWRAEQEDLHQYVKWEAIVRTRAGGSVRGAHCECDCE